MNERTTLSLNACLGMTSCLIMTDPRTQTSYLARSFWLTTDQTLDNPTNWDLLPAELQVLKTSLKCPDSVQSHDIFYLTYLYLIPSAASAFRLLADAVGLAEWAFDTSTRGSGAERTSANARSGSGWLSQCSDNLR